MDAGVADAETTGRETSEMVFVLDGVEFIADIDGVWESVSYAVANHIDAVTARLNLARMVREDFPRRITPSAFRALPQDRRDGYALGMHILLGAGVLRLSRADIESIGRALDAESHGATIH